MVTTMSKQLIPSEGKAAQLKDQLQPGVSLLPLSNTNGVHRGLSMRKFTVMELTTKGYTMQFEADSTILFSYYPVEDEILCISKDYLTTKQHGVIIVWQFIYPVSGE